MAGQTGIQWTDATWNIVTGCTRVSPGCARCYIERTPPFRMAGRRFERVGNAETTGVLLHWDRLEKKPPRGPKVFTPSLSDLFHEEVPRTFVDGAFAAFAEYDDRVFQVLTKRPEEALAYFTTGRPWERVSTLLFHRNPYSARAAELARGVGWPLPNVWLGVSIENARFTWRADVLRATPAAVRFVSAEPLLGSLFVPRDERSALIDCDCNGPDAPTHECCLLCGDDGDVCKCRKPLDLSGIDWLIAGGESGPGARPCDVAWIRELVDRCRVVGVAPFVKQLGAKPLTGSLLPNEYHRLAVRDAKGGDPDDWPVDLRVREFPSLEAVAA